MLLYKLEIPFTLQADKQNLSLVSTIRCSFKRRRPCTYKWRSLFWIHRGRRHPEQRHSDPDTLLPKYHIWSLWNGGWLMSLSLKIRSLWILVRLPGISSGTFRMRFSIPLLPMPNCASRWVPSLILQRFSRGHTIWWQVLRFAICRELHSQANWFEMATLYRQLPCFTSFSTLLSHFGKLSWF